MLHSLKTDPFRFPLFSLAPAFPVFAFIVLWCAAPAPAAGQLRFAELGDFRLENGQVIQNCRIGYRTFGELNDDESNAILFPTWFSGTSQDLVQFVAPDALLDPSKYFVIAVDALGNGISSSPSNSRAQPEKSFPQFSIRDMVDSQHRLLTDVLGINHVYAVIGISMGGMQTFQWVAGYPDFMEKAVPIVGSPRLGSYDLLLWRGQLHAIEEIFDAVSDPEEARASAMRIVAHMHELALTSPAHFNSETPRAQLERKMATRAADLVQRVSPYDWASQLRAMILHDVSAMFGGDFDLAAQAVKAKMLVVVGLEDHMVTPQPALRFAERIPAQKLALESDCGHLSFSCEEQTFESAVREFLEE